MIFVELEALESSSPSKQLVRELALVVGVRVVVSSALLVDLLMRLFGIICFTSTMLVSCSKRRRDKGDEEQYWREGLED